MIMATIFWVRVRVRVSVSFVGMATIMVKFRIEVGIFRVRNSLVIKRFHPDLNLIGQTLNPAPTLPYPNLIIPEDSRRLHEGALGWYCIHTTYILHTYIHTTA